MGDIRVTSAGTTVVGGVLGAAPAVVTLPAATFVASQGPPGATGATGAKGDPGAGAIVTTLANLPAAAGNGGSHAYVTDAGLTPDQRLRVAVDGVWRHSPLTYSVLDYGADPTNTIDSTAAINAAVQAAAQSGNANGPGRTVWMPPGIYRCDGDIHVVGPVTLRGEGSGVPNSPSRLQLGARACVLLHSQGSGPYYAPGGAPVLRGVDCFATRPTFTAWAQSTAYSVGTCVRIPGDAKAYWECIVAGTSANAGTIRAYGSNPELSYAWTPNTKVGYHHVVRRTDLGAGAAAYATYFFSRAGNTQTGATEPAWNATPGATTNDGTVVWEAVDTTTLDTLWFDGTCLWRSRNHSVVVLTGCVFEFQAYNFANAGVAVLGSIGSMPYSNANSWRVKDGIIIGCGQGFYIHGGDTNGGVAEGVTCITIGYEPGTSTPMAYPGGEAAYIGDRTRDNCNYHGILDESFLGCTWLGVTVESTEGRGAECLGGNCRSVFLGLYEEVNCWRSKFSGLVTRMGGIQGAGDVEGYTGISIGSEGVQDLSVRMNSAFTAQQGKLSFASLPGLYNLVDPVDNANHLGWHKSYGAFEPYAFSFGWMPGQSPYGWLFGAQSKYHPDGPGFRNYGLTYHGVTNDDYFVCTRNATVAAAQPQRWRNGRRVVGDRFEPPEGFLDGGTTYVGKRCKTAGYDGATWLATHQYFQAAGYGAPGWAGDLVKPVAGTGNVFECTVSGVTGGGEPNWATAPNPGNTLVDGAVTWTNKGPLAVYGFFGAST